MLSGAEVERFVTDGYVAVRGAVPSYVAAQCRAELWAASGCDPDDPRTWRESLVRLDGSGTPPFRAAANAPVLLEALDQLVGPGGWVPRTGLGTFPLRFPSDEPPREAGWHLESSFVGPDGDLRVSLRSRARALLMLFLFSEVGPDDAPTRIRVGSHLDVPRHLVALRREAGGTPDGDDGDDGVAWLALCERVEAATAHRPVALATGSPGDVFLCHPFLVHAASAHHGRVPRFMAQPPLDPTGLLDLASPDPSPVARAVLLGLGPGPGPGSP